MSSTPAVYFSHMGIFVSDIARMEHFYTEFLGLVASDSGNLGTVRMVFLSRDPTDHHQIVLVEGRPPDARFSVINQISLRVEDPHVAEIDGWSGTHRNPCSLFE